MKGVDGVTALSHVYQSLQILHQLVGTYRVQAQTASNRICITVIHFCIFICNEDSIIN